MRTALLGVNTVFLCVLGIAAKSLSELVALARARPGQLAYASAGNGSSTHLAAELLKSMAAIDMTHIPYKGKYHPEIAFSIQ